MRRLEQRFKLEDLYPEIFQLLELVIPVTNIDELTKDLDIQTLAGIDTTSTGYKTLFTIPSGERWTLKVVRLLRTAGVAAQMSDIAITLPDSAVATPIPITSATGAASQTHRAGIGFPIDISLDERDVLSAYCSTAEAASTFSAWCIYEKQLAF